jgi:predicted metal-binding transcription factor (methanogenesis marker protein 9)
MKKVQTVITAGVDDLNLHRNKVIQLFDIAIAQYNKSEDNYMTSFKVKEESISVEDGNKNVIEVISEAFISETIWIICDDYGDFLLFTALLPHEK